MADRPGGRRVVGSSRCDSIPFEMRSPQPNRDGILEIQSRAAQRRQTHREGTQAARARLLGAACLSVVLTTTAVSTL
jgi:hypothetical protein